MKDLCRLIGWTVIDLLRSRIMLEAEILTLRQQINVLRRAAPKKLSFNTIDRSIFVGLYRLFPRVCDALAIVKPDTIVRWPRAGFRSYWRWKSRRRGGRPTVPLEVRRLIREMRLENQVEILVESEQFDIDEYDRLLAAAQTHRAHVSVTERDHDNVERFLGRHCSPEEALERIQLYERTTAVTEQLLARVVSGVRMTQRANRTTLGFRAYPGGDSRVQCGEVALSWNAKNDPSPVLLTSRNIGLYECVPVASPDRFVTLFPHVTVAELRQP